MSFAALGSLLAAIAMQLIGGFVNRKISFLSRYNIPDPVTGGLIFAVVALIAVQAFDFTISFDHSIKPLLLLMFFAGVGLCADLRLLKMGGKALLLFLALLFPYVALQNVLGLGMAWLLDLHPIFGLVAGSISLTGGHGTAAAYTTGFAQINNLQMVVEIGMMLATIGLIVGGIIGGPITEMLIKKHKLRANTSSSATLPEYRDIPTTISTNSALAALAGVMAAVIGGQWLAAQFAGGPITIPEFLWCMVLGIAIRNLLPVFRVELDDRPAEIISNVSLSLFLVMTMMTLDLLDVIRSAGPFLLIVVAQVILVIVYALFVCFRVMGRDYEASVTTAAFLGFSMGTTATAMANIQAVSARHGPAPTSFLIVPLAGAFFIDVMNVIILTGLLSLPFVGG